MDNTVTKLAREAHEFAKKGDFSGAYERYASALVLDPQNAKLLISAANCSLQLQLPNTEELFEQAAVFGTGDAHIQNDLGIYYASVMKFDTSESFYQTAVALDPDRIDIWTNLAVLYLGQDCRVDEAINILFAIYHAGKANVGILILLGGCYEEVGNLVTARQFYEEALRANALGHDAYECIKRLDRIRPPQLENSSGIEYNHDLIKKLKSLAK